jgi:hypothetical protein
MFNANEETMSDSNLMVKISGNEVTVSGCNTDFPLQVFNQAGKEIHSFYTMQNSYRFKLLKS